MMPTSPPTHCELDKKRRPQRYRYQHQRKELRLYNLPAWRKLRMLHLGKESLCRLCRPRAVLAEVVDHIIPHGGDMDKFLDPDNLQSLCFRCHNVKTMTTDRLLRA